MKLERSNLVIREHDKMFRLCILMPNESGNYLHSADIPTIDDALINRDLLLDQEISSIDVTVREHDRYFRIILDIKDVNGTTHSFHSRKMNVIDVVFERDEIIA